MDSKGFDDWIHWWYIEVKKNSSGPWLLIMDNCEGQEREISIPVVRIELLPPRTTAKYQPSISGLSPTAKYVTVHYCCVLL